LRVEGYTGLTSEKNDKGRPNLYQVGYLRGKVQQRPTGLFFFGPVCVIGSRRLFGYIVATSMTNGTLGSGGVIGGNFMQVVSPVSQGEMMHLRAWFRIFRLLAMLSKTRIL
jgi:hypothetical protein